MRSPARERVGGAAAQPLEARLVSVETPRPEAAARPGAAARPAAAAAHAGAGEPEAQRADQAPEVQPVEPEVRTPRVDRAVRERAVERAG